MGWVQYQLANLIGAGAIQSVRFDVVQVGGFTEAQKIAAYAQMRGDLPASTAATLHLLYAIPNGNYFEGDQVPNAFRHELAMSRFITVKEV